jgi:uncharacterized membrane protein
MLKKAVFLIFALGLLAGIANAGTVIISCNSCGGFPPTKYLKTKYYNDQGQLVQLITGPCGSCNF